MLISALSHLWQERDSGNSQTSTDGVVRIGLFGEAMTLKTTYLETLLGAGAQSDDGEEFHEPTTIAKYAGNVYSW